jgi:hypothetical protein
MSGELHQNSEEIINLHVLIRDYVCRDLCPGGRYCREMKCLKLFFCIAGEIEMKTEELHEGTGKKP